MEYVEFNGKKIETHIVHTLVVGSGAAGFNAALSLYDEGVRDIAILTEGINLGTSRNTGSDKQTYYKLGLCGVPDSPRDMAKDIFDGGCVDGDIAYAEAANSVRCFMRLADLGVKFPTNNLGEYVGYKTDHDKRSRATSAGPLTSKMMTENLQKAVAERNIKIYDNFFALKILKSGEKAVGLVALDKSKDCAPVLFGFENVILATGGPAGMYLDSVYPECHNGATGLAFEAGAMGKNLTEWQYGIASVSPRWNVSGTYMQVLPRIVSVDSEGVEREFVSEYFVNGGKALSMVFKKGYEWPFDCNKIKNGSSVIDLLVWYEKSVLGRRVYLDYTQNPCGAEELDYNALEPEALEYLKSVNACFGKPIDRLLHMNAPAYELYLSRGVDLRRDKLEIALCAQHSNGGVATDLWWKTCVEGLFAVGEAAGTHGVKRPGGSALNAGQVGALRAAQYIAARYKEKTVNTAMLADVATEYLLRLDNERKLLVSGASNLDEKRRSFASEMSVVAGAIRNTDGISKLLARVECVLSDFAGNISVSSEKELYRAYRFRDTLISQRIYLWAMLDYVRQGGASRGSAIYLDGVSDFASLFGFEEADGSLLEKVQEIKDNGNSVDVSWRKIRPLPDGGGVFENVWRDYREKKIFE